MQKMHIRENENLQMRVCKINNLNDIKEIEIEPRNKEIIKLLIEKEQKNAIDILKGLKEEGLIKSIYIPKNKKIKEQLNNLVQAKRINSKALYTLNLNT